MIHFVLHEAKDTVAVAVVEGIKAGTDLTAWIMDDDKQIPIKALQDIPIGHKIALKDMAVGISCSALIGICLSSSMIQAVRSAPALIPSTTATATVSFASCNTK